MSRIVLVTGAARGLGRAITEAFAANGDTVIAGYRSDFPGSVAPNISPRKMDVTLRPEVDGVFSETAEKFGRLDVLVNNAGITKDLPVTSISEADWDALHHTNLNGAFYSSRAACRLMAGQPGGGHILSIGSFTSQHGSRGQANYGASKAALLGLTLALAREMGSRNVRVNAILPGLLKTGITRELTPEQWLEFEKQNVLGRVNTFEEITRFICFLSVTQNISGQVFQLDSRIGNWL